MNKVNESTILVQDFIYVSLQILNNQGQKENTPNDGHDGALYCTAAHIVASFGTVVMSRFEYGEQFSHKVVHMETYMSLIILDKISCHTLSRRRYSLSISRGKLEY